MFEIGHQIPDFSLVDQDGKTVLNSVSALDNTYTATKTAIHVGESFYLRLTDPDRNSSPQQDELKINLKSQKTGAEHELVLTETMPYSGIFTASLKPYLKQQIEQARQAACPAEQLEAPLLDYGVPRRVRPSLGRASYSELLAAASATEGFRSSGRVVQAPHRRIHR